MSSPLGLLLRILVFLKIFNLYCTGMSLSGNEWANIKMFQGIEGYGLTSYNPALAFPGFLDFPLPGIRPLKHIDRYSARSLSCPARFPSMHYKRRVRLY